MGFFGKLFEKKYCGICGAEIGLLGNRKLEDGNLCKDCAAKLSPWFSDRRQSTVQEIGEQLAYRERNRDAVAAFHVTRSFGRSPRVLFDDAAGKFMITSARNIPEANPDVLDLSQVTGCDLNIDESRTEERHPEKDPDGHTHYVSFDPPHFTYRYEFRITVQVNHPYFDHMSFVLNDSSVSIETIGPIDMAGPGMPPPPEGNRPGAPVPPHENRPGAPAGPNGNRPGAPAGPNGNRPGAPAGPNGNRPGAPAGPNGNRPGGPLPPHENRMGAPMPPRTDPRMMNPEYVERMNTANEIRNALLRTDSQTAASQSVGGSYPAFCMNCGAPADPDAYGRCRRCGSPLRQ